MRDVERSLADELGEGRGGGWGKQGRVLGLGGVRGVGTRGPRRDRTAAAVSMGLEEGCLPGGGRRRSMG